MRAPRTLTALTALTGCRGAILGSIRLPWSLSTCHWTHRGASGKRHGIMLAGNEARHRNLETWSRRIRTLLLGLAMGERRDAICCLPWSPKGTVPGREKLPRGAGAARSMSRSWGRGELSDYVFLTSSRNSLDRVTSFRILGSVVRGEGR